MAQVEVSIGCEKIFILYEDGETVLVKDARPDIQEAISILENGACYLKDWLAKKECTLSTGQPE